MNTLRRFIRLIRVCFGKDEATNDFWYLVSTHKALHRKLEEDHTNGASFEHIYSSFNHLTQVYEVVEQLYLIIEEGRNYPTTDHDAIRAFITTLKEERLTR